MQSDPMALTAIHLRLRAARCRAMADTAPLPEGIAEELCALAADYEGDAERLEHRLGQQSPYPRRRRPDNRPEA